MNIDVKKMTPEYQNRGFVGTEPLRSELCL